MAKIALWHDNALPILLDRRVSRLNSGERLRIQNGAGLSTRKSWSGNLSTSRATFRRFRRLKRFKRQLDHCRNATERKTGPTVYSRRARFREASVKRAMRRGGHLRRERRPFAADVRPLPVFISPRLCLFSFDSTLESQLNVCVCFLLSRFFTDRHSRGHRSDTITKCCCTTRRSASCRAAADSARSDSSRSSK